MTDRCVIPRPVEDGPRFTPTAIAYRLWPIDAYLDELEWRFNNRDNPWLFRDTLIRLLKSEHVEYEELMGS